MTPLGVVLARAATASAAVHTYRGLLRHWGDPQLAEVARRHHRAEVLDDRNVDDPPFRLPDERSQESTFDIAASGDDPPATRWRSGPDNVWSTQREDEAEHRYRFVGALGGGVVTHPLRLMAGRDVAVATAATVVGRPTTRLSVRCRPAYDPMVASQWSGADEAFLDIDDETGIALRWLERWKGSTIAISEFLRVGLNADLTPTDLETDLGGDAAEAFTAEFRDASADEAAALAPFPLLRPQRIPEGATERWHVRDEGDNSLEIQLSYEVEGDWWLSIEQQSADLAPPREDISRFDLIERHGNRVYVWRSPSGLNGRHRVLVERGRTRARLCGLLSIDEWIDVALSLRAL